MEQNIMAKLMQIQQTLRAPKGQRNTFGNYNYRSCEDILEAVKPILRDTETVLTISDDLTEIGGRVYVKATATLWDTGTGASIQNIAFAREPEDKKGQDASQITGAASSYARKYALNGLFCIDDVKDADATNKHGKDAPSPKEEAAIRAEIMRITSSFPGLVDQIRQRYGVDRLQDLSGADAAKCLRLLKKYEQEHAA